MRELILAFHHIHALDNNELGCMSAIKHEISINNSEPFKEQFRYIPSLLLEEVHASLHDMLDAGVIPPSQFPWCNAVILICKKDGTLLPEWKDQERFVPVASDTASPQEYGGCCTLLHDRL